MLWCIELVCIIMYYGVVRIKVCHGVVCFGLMCVAVCYCVVCIVVCHGVVCFGVMYVVCVLVWYVLWRV